jgi:single-strand DNA-binding protein
MANLNKVLLMGRLTADPELKKTPSNISVTTFTLAVNRRYSQDNPQVDFIDIVCWRNNAEFVTKYFRKGSAAFVSGSLQVRTWQDKEGKNRRVYEVVADEVQFAENKRDSNARYEEAPSFTAGTPGDFEEMTGDDELPF